MVSRVMSVCFNPFCEAELELRVVKLGETIQEILIRGSNKFNHSSIVDKCSLAENKTFVEEPGPGWPETRFTKLRPEELPKAAFLSFFFSFLRRFFLFSFLL